MRGRSPLSHLGILDLQAGILSLRDAKGSQLFAVPAETVQARPARRKFCETRRKFFETRRPGFGAATGWESSAGLAAHERTD
jgi:hypothetical protein